MEVITDEIANKGIFMENLIFSSILYLSVKFNYYKI